MTRTTLHLHRGTSLVAGSLAAAGFWWYGVSPGLAAAVGLATLVAGLLLFKLAREHPDHGTGSTWQDHAWFAGFVAFLTLVAFQGLLWTPVSFEYTVALHALVGLVGIVGYFVGLLDGLGSSARTDGATHSAEPADD